jgi:hypothetical protein
MTDEHSRLKTDKHHSADAAGVDKSTGIRPHPQLEETPELEDELLDNSSDSDRHAKRAKAPGESTPRKYIAYTVKLPSDQLAALQSIWLELKHLYGANSPDKSGMIQQAVEDWLRRWDGQDREALLEDLLEIRQDTRKRQYRKY